MAALAGVNREITESLPWHRSVEEPAAPRRLKSLLKKAVSLPLADARGSINAVAH
jgi:hypothetical protein